MAVKSSDQITIVDLTDGYSIMLSLDAISLNGDISTLGTAQSVTVNVTAYKGGVKAVPTVGTPTCPANVSASVGSASNSVVPVTISFAAALTTAGKVTIPVTVDDVTINKEFAFGISFKGATGATGETGPKGDTGADGEDAILLKITTSAGDIFKNSSGSTILTVHAYVGGAEVTGVTLTALGTVKWYKDGSYMSGKDGVSLTVNASDINSKSTYEAKLEALGEIIARDSITIIKMRDITSITWFYKLQASTALLPDKPTTLNPSGWTTTEPTYTEGSTNSLYVCQRTLYSDDTFEYSDVSLSTSYEAAKTAYNKAQAAASDAANAMTSANSKNKIFHQSSAPLASVGLQVGDTWFDTSKGYKINTWDGSQWVAEPLDTDALAVGAVKAQTIDAGAVTAEKIAAHSINAEKLEIGDFANYATVNPLMPGTMCNLSNMETVMASGESEAAYCKKVETQHYISLDTVHVPNSFKNGAQFYFDITARTEANSGNVLLKVGGYRATYGYQTGSRTVSLALTTIYTRFTGSIELDTADFDTVPYILFYLIDNRGTSGSGREQIYIKSAKIFKKSEGELIVDGSITADKIRAEAVTADKIKAGAITTEKLAVGDFNNYATVNQYTGEMNNTSGRETVIFTDTNNNNILVYRKKTESQNYLPVAVGLVTNPFKTGDEVYYDITLRTTSGNARDVQLMIACYDASKTFITGHGVTLSLTASYQRFTGSRSITNASFDTAAYVFFYINDNNDTKKQILVQSAKIFRKYAGNLIVDGSISASQILGGTFTVGGSGNGRGQINILDANDNNVGTWNNNGLTGAKRLETAMGDRQELTFNSGIKNNADTVTSGASKVRIIPKGIQSIDSEGTYRSQLLPAKFNGTTYDGSVFGQNGVPQYGWYVTPMLYVQRIFSKTGEGFTWGDWSAERHNFRDDLLENYVPDMIQDALDNFETNVVDPQLDDFLYKYFDEIDTWNTPYDKDESPVKFLKSYQAANSPESGSAHFIGLELSFSSNHRIQLAMRTNTTAVAAPLYIRHSNGSWLGWAKITPTAV